MQSSSQRSRAQNYLKTYQNVVEFLLILSQKLMGSRTLLSKLMGSVEPIEPVLTEPLITEVQ